jgi:flagellar biosynthesis protein FliQ
MTQDTVTSLLVDMMGITVKVAMPMLLAALIVGLLISIFQAVTQIQEQTLSFIPKIVALVVVLIVAGPWMLSSITDWTSNLWGGIPQTVDFKPVGGSDGP